MWRSRAGARERSRGARGATGDVRERNGARKAGSSRLKTSPRERGQAVRAVGHGRSAFRGATGASLIDRSKWMAKRRKPPSPASARDPHERVTRPDETLRSPSESTAAHYDGRSPHEDDTVERRNSTPRGATALKHEPGAARLRAHQASFRRRAVRKGRPSAFRRARQVVGAQRRRHDDDRCVRDVARLRPPEQRSHAMGSLFVQSNHITAPEEPSELRLLRRPAHLRDDRRRDARHDPHLQSSPMLRPKEARVPVGGDQRPRVVDHRSHRLRERRARRRARPCFDSTCSRASSISSSVNTPCAASHSPTAASPSRIRSARRAAAVIQAETLTP